MKFFYRFHANAECQLGLSGWSLTSSPAHLFARRGWLGLSVELRLYRSSRSEVLCKKGALENFAKSTGKHLCQSLFFNKVTGLRFATLLKKRVWRRCLPVNFGRFERAPFLIEHLRQLLLTLPSHGDIILNSISQTRGKWKADMKIL